MPPHLQGQVGSCQLDVTVSEVCHCTLSPKKGFCLFVVPALLLVGLLVLQVRVPLEGWVI